jgi:Tfp pilus assembly protein PilV
MKNEQGQSLFEVLIALAVSALIIISLVSLVNNAIQNAAFSKNKSLASTYAQEATEWLRGQRDSDINTFQTNVATSVWCLQDLSWTKSGACATGDEIASTPFMREVTFSGTTVVEANIVISWKDSLGDHQVVSATNFADWRQR